MFYFYILYAPVNKTIPLKEKMDNYFFSFCLSGLLNFLIMTRIYIYKWGLRGYAFHGHVFLFFLSTTLPSGFFSGNFFRY